MRSPCCFGLPPLLPWPSGNRIWFSVMGGFVIPLLRALSLALLNGEFFFGASTFPPPSPRVFLSSYTNTKIANHPLFLVAQASLRRNYRSCSSRFQSWSLGHSSCTAHNGLNWTLPPLTSHQTEATNSLNQPFLPPQPLHISHPSPSQLAIQSAMKRTFLHLLLAPFSFPRRIRGILKPFICLAILWRKYPVHAFWSLGAIVSSLSSAERSGSAISISFSCVYNK